MVNENKSQDEFEKQFDELYLLFFKAMSEYSFKKQNIFIQSAIAALLKSAVDINNSVSKECRSTVEEMNTLLCLFEKKTSEEKVEMGEENG